MGDATLASSSYGHFGVNTAHFTCHTQTIKAPEVQVTFALYAPDKKMQLAGVASDWVAYYIKMLTDLQSSTNPALTTDIRAAFTKIYSSELQKHVAIMTDAVGINATAPSSAAISEAVTASAAAAQTRVATTHITAAGTNTNIKANLPNRYTGRTDLGLFMGNMETYFSVMNVPSNKQAGLLKLNLSDAVNTILTNTYKSTPTFWENKEDIVTALKQLYEQPNRVATAQTTLKRLYMRGYNLPEYYNQFVALVGQAEYDANAVFVKTAFCQGLNNLAALGGLRTQLISSLNDTNTTLNALYTAADLILRTDHGEHYNNLKCPANADEHSAPRPITTRTDEQQPSASEWTTVAPRYKPRKFNSYQQQQPYNNTENKNKFKRARYDKTLHCTRCNNTGHNESTCNARKDAKTGKELNIKTAALYKSGVWKEGRYPEKRNPDNKKISRTNNINALVAPMEIDDATEHNNYTAPNNNNANVPAFGISTIDQLSFKEAALKGHNEAEKVKRAAKKENCKSHLPLRLHMWMCLFIYIHVANAHYYSLSSLSQNNDNNNIIECDYSLDFDTLCINKTACEEANVNGITAQPEITSGNYNLTYCPVLIQYVIHIKDNNKRLTALFDPGSGFSAINSDKLAELQAQKSPYALKAGLAANTSNNKFIDKIDIDSHVNISYKIGNFSDNYSFRVFPGLQADMLLGLDWAIHHNPMIPDWSSGVMYIKRHNKNKNTNNIFRIKAVKPIIRIPDKNINNKETNNVQQPKVAEGLISAIEVSKSTDWDCLVLLVKPSSEESNIDEFYKPHFEEPPLYTPSQALSEQQQQLLDNLKANNHEVLRLKLPSKLPPHRPGDTPIAPTEPGVKPVKRPAYQLSPSQNLEVKRQLKGYIDKGYLQPSHSPWGAPVFLVKKPHSDQWRMVCDWRGLNKLTIKDRFEIPNPAQLFDKLGGFKWFTKLDLAQGYHQLPLSEDDRIKSAIVTRYGSYEWNVASFGMTNVPSVFQRVLGNVLFEYTDTFVVNFFDDILIYTKDDDLNTHIKHIQLVLNKLKEAQLYVNPEKCTWFATSVPYLGFEINSQGIRCSKEKIKTISDWPIPRTVKHIKQFLGLCSYYRKFINKFATIAAPLHELTKGYKKQKGGKYHGAPFKWTPVQQQAFTTLKEKLITHPVLKWPDFSKPFTIVPDASGFAIGGVLCQDHGHGLQPVAYESRKLNGAESRYPVHEQELLAILHCCKKWRYYLIGAETKVHTDHAPLQHLQTQPHLSNRQARWLDFLAEYNLHIQPIKGKDNIIGDAVSRRPDYMIANSTYIVVCNNDIMCANIVASQYFQLTTASLYDNDKITSSAEYFHQCEPLQSTVNAIITCTTQEEAQLFKMITSFYQDDELVQDLISGERKYIPANTGKYTVLNNIIYFVTKDERYLLYIPPSAIMPKSDISLRQQLIQETHDTLYAGHFGTSKTLNRLQQQFYWPQIYVDVADYCRSCIPCQRNKPSNRKPLGLLQPMPIAFRPWQTISIDFITKLPKSVDGYDAIMVVIDQLSKRAHFITTTTTASAAQTAHLFFNNIWKHHGLPSKIISDRDSKFTAKFWQTLWSLLGTKLAMSTAYSPQTDGQTERLNRTLEEYIRAYIDTQTNNWAQLLTPAEYAYNNAKHESTGFSPFELDCGRCPNDPLFIFTSAAKQHSASDRVINTLDDYLQQMVNNWTIARNALLLSQQYQKRFYDLRHSHDEFYVGDEVFLSTQRQNDYGKIKYASDSDNSKFEPRYLGPFKIISKASSHAYELDLPPSMKIHPVIHIRYLLRPRVANKFPDRIVDYRQPPEIIDTQPEYEVEAILNKRLRKYGRGSRIEYLIHWKGYPSEEDTWEPLAHLTHCKDILNAYERSLLRDAPIQNNCIFVV